MMRELASLLAATDRQKQALDWMQRAAKIESEVYRSDISSQQR